MKNSNKNCFLWCHIRHLKSLKMHPEKIVKQELINTLDYERIKYHVSKKDFEKIEEKNKICINIFCYQNKLTYLFTYQMKNVNIQWIC